MMPWDILWGTRGPADCITTEEIIRLWAETQSVTIASSDDFFSHLWTSLFIGIEEMTHYVIM